MKAPAALGEKRTGSGRVVKPSEKLREQGEFRVTPPSVAIRPDKILGEPDPAPKAPQKRKRGKENERPQAHMGVDEV